MTRTSSRPEIVFALVGAVLLVGAIVSVVLGAAGHGGGAAGVAAAPAAASTPVSTESAPPADETPAPAAGVDPADVSAVLDAYANAYDDEDATALGLVLADTITRTSNGVRRDGIDAVLAGYQRQFEVLDSPTYTLSSVDISPEEGGATVSAFYSITADNADESTGTIAFHLVETDLGLLIDAVDAQPDQ